MLNSNIPAMFHRIPAQIFNGLLLQLFIRRFARLLWVMAASAVVTACAGWPGPDSTRVAESTGEAATAAKTSGAACPTAKARYLNCSNGVKLLTYESAFELPRYCESVQQFEGKVRGFDRNQPLHKLPEGERVMLVGTAGWLLLPREPELTDVPQSMAAWWNNRACTLPTALRP